MSSDRISRQELATAVLAAAERLDIEVDSAVLREILARRSSRPDGEEGLAELAGTLSALGIDATWREIAPEACRSPWISSRRAAGSDRGLVVGLGRRGIRYELLVCTAGTRRILRVFASGLRRATGLEPGELLGVLVIGVARPLAALRDSRHELGPWGRLRRFIRLEREDIGVTLVYGVAIGLLSLMLPIAAQALVTTVAFGSILQPLVVLALLFAFAAGAAGVLRLLQAWVVEVIQQRLFARAVADVAMRLVALPTTAFDTMHLPDLTNRFFEVPTMQKALAAVLICGVGLVMQTVVGLTLLGFYHPLLLSFALLLLGLLVVVIFLFGRGAVDSALDESKAKYQAAGWLEHLARIPTAFKSARGRSMALQQADDLVRRYLGARRRHFRRLLLQSGGGIALAVGGPTVLLGLGGWLVLRNQLSLGQIVAAELVMAGLSAALVKLGKELESVYDLVQATTKLGRLIDLPQERCGGDPLETGVEHGSPLSIGCHDVVLELGSKAVLDGCELAVEAGAKVAIRGAGGSGKSLLLEVLAGFREPTRGSVEVDGCDLRAFDLASVRESVVLVRDAEFIDGTVLSNLRLLRQDASVGAVEHALAAVGLREVVRSLSEGLMTAMQPSGVPFSSSQKRRLVLARAILAEPRLLLVDGTLDGLGQAADGDASVLEMVLGADWPCTVIAVTQDASVIARCAAVFDLDRGRIGERR